MSVQRSGHRSPAPHPSRRRAPRSWSTLLLTLALAPTFPLLGAERFSPLDRLEEPADWITADNGIVVFGSATALAVAREGELDEPLQRLDARETITSAALFLNRLYVAVEGERLAVLRIDEPGAALREIELVPALRGPIVVGRVDNDLLVAETGRGVRVLSPPAGHGTSDDPIRLTRRGEVALEGALGPVAGVGERSFTVIDGRGLAEIDHRERDRPQLARTLPLEIAPRALVTTPGHVFLLGAAGLSVLDVDATPPRISGPHPVPEGSGLLVGGRTVHVAGPAGLSTLRDEVRGSQLFTVTVSDTVFTPSSVTLDVGDQVRWRNTSGIHNAEACDGVSDPPACNGQVADETFTSGSPAGGAWTFTKTFNVAGENPYFCAIHAGFGMTGLVRVNGPFQPPGVSDGSVGPPLRVQKLDPSGSTLGLSWNDFSCAPVQHQIVFGGGSLLPSTPGGPFGVGGAVCSIGPLSPYTWSGTPSAAADPTGLLWFLVVSTDGASTEGAWGRGSDGVERAGPGVGGSSGQCGMTGKSLTNTCGQ